MLKSSIAMLKAFLFLTLLIQNPGVTLTSPQPGDVLRGQVEIVGSMDVPNFSSAELSFSFTASDSADSWFVIQTFPQPKLDSPIAVWDTTSLTDGDYVLHLRVFLQDGSIQDAVIPDLKIRNEVILPTETPTEVFDISTPFISVEDVTAAPALPTQTLSFTQPTSLPANPASLNRDEITSTFTRGALITFLSFGLIWLVLRLRKNN
jgi:hypothetical protein